MLNCVLNLTFYIYLSINNGKEGNKIGHSLFLIYTLYWRKYFYKLSSLLFYNRGKVSSFKCPIKSRSPNAMPVSALKIVILFHIQWWLMLEKVGCLNMCVFMKIFVLIIYYRPDSEPKGKTLWLYWIMTKEKK